MSLRVYYNENDKNAAAWLWQLMIEGLIPAGDVDERSIKEVTGEDLKEYDQCHFFAGIGGWAYALELAGWGDRPVWTGSCPCQPFSAAGKGGGVDDERHLWPDMLRLIEERRPPIVFGEQVASKAGREWYAGNDGVRDQVQRVGYASAAVDMCAASVGAPHIRQRLFWVADAKGQRRKERAGENWQQDESSIREGWLDSAGISCLDGKTRRVESGVSPLVDGIPRGVVPRCYPSPSYCKATAEAKMMRLKGYGNAIVPQVAAEFILMCEAS